MTIPKGGVSPAVPASRWPSGDQELERNTWEGCSSSGSVSGVCIFQGRFASNTSTLVATSSCATFVVTIRDPSGDQAW